MEEKKSVLPTLTLDPTEDLKAEEVSEPVKEIKPVQLDEETLSEEERQLVNDFAEKIDLTNSNVILQYGAAAQTKISTFSQSALDKVKTKDLGEVGESLTSLVTELKGFEIDNEENNGFFGFFKKQSNKITQLKAQYDKADANVEKIIAVLEKHQIQLMKDIAMLDQMYELNLQNFKELSHYILAGKKKLAQAQNEELPKLVAQAEKSGLPEDAQRANDYAAFCTRFEKKLHDLELTRMISIQMAPQIRLVQNNDTMMAEKIQSSLVNTIPLWKSQMVLALGVENSRQAMEAQRAVTDMTNDLLRKNAETLKVGTIATAKESERGIVDIETLQNTNKKLIETLDEVMKIQAEGRTKRREAEAELGRIEGELKQKLTEINL